jgi:hypothetical protein
MFAHRQIVFQTLFVNTSERAQKVAGCRPQSFDGVDMHLSHSISIVISRPLFLAMTHTCDIKAQSSSADRKRVALPDVVCSTRPVQGAGPTRNCTTKARCGDRGDIPSVVGLGFFVVSSLTFTVCCFFVMV